MKSFISTNSEIIKILVNISSDTCSIPNWSEPYVKFRDLIDFIYFLYTKKTNGFTIRSSMHILQGKYVKMEVAEGFEGYELKILILTKVGSNRIDVGKSIVFQCERCGNIQAFVERTKNLITNFTFIKPVLQ